MYDPAIGRWFVVDPMAEAAPDWTPYRYGFNNPMKYTDPTGMFEYVKGGYGEDIEVGNVWSHTADGGYLSDNKNDKGDGGQPNGGGIQNCCGGEKSSSDKSNQSKLLLSACPSGDCEDQNGPWNAAIAATAVLVADDVTGVGVADDILIPIILAGAAAYDLTQRIYITYTLSNPKTGQTYVGRTSGFGNPYSVMMSRYNSHHMKALGYTVPTLDRAAQGVQGYPAIRGREQQMIDSFGGVSSGNVANSIRGVSKLNPFGPIYHETSNMFFGPLAPYSGY